MPDADGRRWLVCGSCWSDITLSQLDTGLSAHADAASIALAAHPPDNVIAEG